MLHFFQAGAFADQMNNLGKMMATLHAFGVNWEVVRREFNAEEERNRILVQLQIIRRQLGDIPLSPSLNAQWDRCELHVERLTADRIQTTVILLRELQENLLEELKQPRYLMVPSDKAPLLTTGDPFGDAVSATLPKATVDVREGVSCYALERWTAAVFHLMRAAEHALRFLATDLGVENIEAKDFGQLVQESNDKNRARNSRDPEKKWIADALASLDLFKDAWRNPVCHARDDHYNEERARDVYNGTRAFMQSIARRATR